MIYLMLFLEGIITFISPCLLPMLPLYLSYFAGGSGGKKGRALKNTLGFVLGFSLFFMLMGAFAGSIGFFLRRHETAINLITGAIVILFGLYFLGLIKLPFSGRGKSSGVDVHNLGFFSSVLFGVVFSVSWTPCVGAFLTVALGLAAGQGSTVQGVLMLLCFSLGIGLPFVICALVLDQLKTAFDWIKRHYDIINRISGILLIALGILMMTGLMGRFLSMLA